MLSIRLQNSQPIGTDDLFLDHKYPHHIQDIDGSDIVHIIDEHSLEQLAPTAWDM